MKSLNADANFYHCYFDWSNDPDSQGELAEQQLAAAVDMIWADSPINFARASTMHDNVITLTKGVDIKLFEQARSDPSKSASKQRPLCAIFGTIGIHTNVDLLRAISQEFP
ncbi:MAG: hypothetical protein R3C44_03080 [Chloroflexota bacterium]